MTHSTLPKNSRALLNDLEAIEQVKDEKHSASLKARAKEACQFKFQEAFCL
jgi:hypothetical protein